MIIFSSWVDRYICFFFFFSFLSLLPNCKNPIPPKSACVRFVCVSKVKKSKVNFLVLLSLSLFFFHIIINNDKIVYNVWFWFLIWRCIYIKSSITWSYNKLTFSMRNIWVRKTTWNRDFSLSQTSYKHINSSTCKTKHRSSHIIKRPTTTTTT